MILLALAMPLAWTACSSDCPDVDNSTSPQAVGEVKELTTAGFKEKLMDYEAHPNEWVYKGSRPAVVDFYATWCPHCKEMEPILDELAKEYAGKIDFYKVDTDKEEELAGHFGVEAWPTFYFLPMKGKPSKEEGSMEKAEFEKIMKEALGE